MTGHPKVAQLGPEFSEFCNMGLWGKIADRFAEPKIEINLDEIDVEKLMLTAIFRAAPGSNSRDWDGGRVDRLQAALSDAKSRQTEDQDKQDRIDLRLTEEDWKAVGRLCLTIGEDKGEKWARDIAGRIMVSATRRGKV